MSFDRMDNISGAYPGALPRRSVMTPKFEGKSLIDKASDAGLDLADLSGRAIGPVSAANKSVVSQWADKTTAWSTQAMAEEMVNTVTSPKGRAGQLVDQGLSKLGIRPKQQALAKAAEQAPKNYSRILHLGAEQVSVKDLSWQNYKQAVQNNLKPFKQATQGQNIKNFFKDVSAKSYVKGTVVENNLKPIKDLFTNSPEKQIGSGLLRTAAVGLMGFDVLKHTNDAHKHAKAKEDGSLKSKWNTCKESTVALAKYAARDIATWEAAGIGAAIGKAVIPIALGGVSMGGIAVGAMVGLAAQKALNSALKTGDKDPVQQKKMQQKEAEKAAKKSQELAASQQSAVGSSNPFIRSSQPA